MANSTGACHAQVEPIFYRKTFPAGAHLFHQGDPDRGVYKIVSGTVTAYRVTADGYRQIEAFSGAGEYVSLCLSATSPTSAEALSDVEVDFMRRCMFERRLLENPEFRHEIFQDIDNSAAESRRKAIQLAYRSARSRVADFVFFLDANFQKRPDGYCPIPMSRCDIADYLGLTLETVSRMLNRFKQIGVIELPRPDRFRLLDPRRLEAITRETGHPSLRAGVGVEANTAL